MVGGKNEVKTLCDDAAGCTYSTERISVRWSTGGIVDDLRIAIVIQFSRLVMNHDPHVDQAALVVDMRHRQAVAAERNILQLFVWITTIELMQLDLDRLGAVIGHHQC